MKSTLIKATKEAGKIVMKYFKNYGKLKFKNPRSLVTQADLASEKKIISIIKKKYPSHNFITEESGAIKGNSEYTWIIDPIDGTTNFVAGIPYFSVSIALAKNNEIEMGCVLNPTTDEMFFAEKGKGSFLNNKRLSVSRKNKMLDCILVFSLPGNEKLGKKTMMRIAKNFGKFRSIREMGSAALDMCYLADKRFDLYFSQKLNVWDIAAAKLIVEEANGKTTNIKNKEWDFNEKTMVATNKIMHDKFLNLIK